MLDQNFLDKASAELARYTERTDQLAERIAVEKHELERMQRMVEEIKKLSNQEMKEIEADYRLGTTADTGDGTYPF